MFIAAAAGAGAAAKTVWGYNRENYMYDRTMKQQADLRVFDFRSNQVGQWREDIRDITNLTVEKMGTYLVIGTVLFGAAITQLTNGALDASVPPWLSHYYMMTLATTFGYLFLSAWCAMHASNIAQSSAVRILTQFVRLPVPTWEQLQESRTYATSFENLEGGNMLRIPFVGNPRHVPQKVYKDSQQMLKEKENTPVTRISSGGSMKGSLRGGLSGSTIGEEQSVGNDKAAVDPWQLEPHQEQNEELYELQRVPVCLRRHVRLARRAAMQYQCFDAFARASMTFGINQFIHAIIYYALGKVAHSGGSHPPAWCMLVVLLIVAHNLIKLDFTVGNRESPTAALLQWGGPLLAAAAVLLWAVDMDHPVIQRLVVVSYFFQGAWLLFILHLCGIRRQENGAFLPMRMRATLYLDVFGWLDRLEESAGEDSWSPFGDATGSQDLLNQADQDFGRQYSHRELNELERRFNGNIPPNASLKTSMSEGNLTRSPSRRKWQANSGLPDGNTGLLRSGTTSFRPSDGVWRSQSAAGEMPETAHAFMSWDHRVPLENGEEYEEPSKIPAKVFRSVTRTIGVLWMLGGSMTYLAIWEKLKLPLTDGRI